MPRLLKDYSGMTAIALLFLLGFGGIAVGIERATAPDPIGAINATPALTGAPDLLVDAPWLIENRAQVQLIIDLSDRDVYEQEHIPGAVHIWYEDAMPLHAPDYGQGGVLSDPADVSLTLNYPQDTPIVVYDNNASERAAWFLWLLRTNGYGNSWLLDGGIAAWKGAGQETSTEPAELVTVGTPTPTWVQANEIDTAELSGRLEDPNLMIVDARTAEAREDSVNETIRIGQIPGSVSVPSPSVMRDDGTFRSAEELRDIFASVGIEPTSEVVIYGRFGTETGRVWLALHLAGIHTLRVYDDGWVHWGWNHALPIEPLATPS